VSLRSNDFSKPILCYVSDRRTLGADGLASLPRLVEKICELAQAGVDWIQLREKDLSGRACAELTRRAVHIWREQPMEGRTTRILVNDRLDVALSEGADGVHLGVSSLKVEDARRLAPEGFLVGASVHSPESAKRVAGQGADYLIFGPVFATPSKAEFGEPQGLERLREVCLAVRIPVLAIGGITLQNAADCVQAGAAGIAAIRLFQDGSSPASAVAALRKHTR
jgi:thiamine-phosphate pyrophosphorylase